MPDQVRRVILFCFKRIGIMRNVKSVSLKVLVAAAIALGASGVAPAIASDGGEIKYRKAVMKAVGGHMNALVGIVKGETANKDDMKALADGMLGLAKVSQGIFPKGSDEMGGETDAKMAIWDKADDFKKVNMAFVTYAEGVVKAAASGDPKMLGAAVGALGKNACKACHDDYKKKD